MNEELPTDSVGSSLDKYLTVKLGLRRGDVMLGTSEIFRLAAKCEIISLRKL